ncbi:MAG: GNAT family N-acetyltransferase [Candidatus Thorarchaeota archaeon]|jgi:ribosomal protein S18 acetylase RimI-like enzyme
MTASDSFLLEPGNDAMFDDYAALYNAIDSRDNPDHIELSGEYFRSSFSYPTIEIGRDIVQIHDSEGCLVAAGTIFSQNTSPPSSRIMVQVHPDYQKKGIGSMVLEHLFQTGKNNGSTLFVGRIPSFRPDAIAFAEYHGFKHDYSWIKMRLKYEELIRTIVPPQGLKIKTLDIKTELETWAQLQNDIFRDSPDYEETTVESLKAQIRHTNFDSGLLVIGEVNGRPVGLCTGWSITPRNREYKNKVVQIQGLGVLPENRQNGYGQALLFEVLHRAFLKGHRISELVVRSSNLAAISMYMKYGFHERYRHLWYKRLF